MGLSAIFGVVAALAFVLALLALSVWGLKRLGLTRLGGAPGARLPVEVVQRMPLGPKTSIAVVRVGETVMAVSIADGAVQPLFEVSEADRQTVLESSRVAQPFVSSVGVRTGGLRSLGVRGARGTRAHPRSAEPDGTPAPAGAPAPLGGTATANGDDRVRATGDEPVRGFADALVAAQRSDVEAMRQFYDAPADPAPMSAATPRQRALRSAVATAAIDRVDAVLTPPEGQVPVTMSARIAPQAQGMAAFQSVLRMAMSGATRLAGVAIVLALIGAPAGVMAQAAGATATGGAAPTVAPTTTPAPGTATATNRGGPVAAPATPTPAVTQPAAPARATPAVGPGGAAGTNGAPNAAPTAAANPNATAGTQPTPRGSVQPRVPSGPPARDTKSRAAQPPSTEAVVPGVPPRTETVSPTTNAPTMSVSLGNQGKGDGLQVNGTVGVVLLMGMLTLLPTMVLMMTGFTRILIVLNFLKQAMGTQNAPPGQLVAALALILTGFVMAPTIEAANRTAITPWLDGSMEQMTMLKTAAVPFREFMLAQTRESDLRTFIELSGAPAPATPNDIPLVTLMSAFTASELRTAFQIGFAIYLPFIVIDAVVASVLMSMGMMMLPPAMISMPFKLLLFVLVDGWTLVVESLVRSFR